MLLLTDIVTISRIFSIIELFRFLAGTEQFPEEI